MRKVLTLERRAYIPYIHDVNEIVRTSAFKTGNSVAVRLPKAFGIKPGEDLEIVKRGSSVIISLRAEADVEREKMEAFLKEMRALGPVGGDPNDGRIELPDRPGLY